MDRRNFIFIFLFTITIFFVHNYFIADNNQYTPQTEQQIVEEKAEFSDQEIFSRTAKPSSLPLVNLFVDQEGRQTAATSVAFQDHYMIYSSQDLPRELYIKSANGSFEAVSCIADATKTTPAVYSHSPSSPLYSIHLPQIGGYDVQLVHFNEDSSQVAVTFARYENDSIHFPREVLDAKAIILAKDQGQYYPIGFYTPDSKKIVPINSTSDLAKIVTFKPTSTIKVDSSAKNESFYVLENDYAQFVFSNYGGAVSEINLPFKTKENTSSVVLPIKFDRMMEKQYSRNAYFPSKQYKVANTTGLQDPTIGGYYPLLRRDIEGASGRTSFHTPPRFYALNIVSEDDPELAQKQYSVTRLEKNLIEFQLISSQRKITKTFTLSKVNDTTVPYALDVQVRVEGDTRNLDITTGVPEVELISGSYSPDIKYRYIRNGKPVVEKLKLPKDSIFTKGITPTWVGTSNGFFGVILNPLKDASSSFEATHIPGDMDPTRISIIDAEYSLYPADKYPGYMVQLPLRSSAKTFSFRVFAGPFDQAILKQVDTLLTDPVTKMSPGFLGAQSFHGWFAFISEPFAKFLFLLMKMFYSFTHSWGICIILITIALKIMMYPLNAWSMKSMAKMQMIAPDVAAIKSRYSKDPKRAKLEEMQLYKDKGVNPFSGCLPLLIQMPFLIGMFDLLKSAFPLRGTSFVPGWIDNLTAPDVLFSWSYPIFFFGTELHFLPFILGGLTFLQQKIATYNNRNKVIDPETLKQTKMTGNIMTLVFTFAFYNFPSGLNIYWISSTALGILQQWWIQKNLMKKQTFPKKI